MLTDIYLIFSKKGRSLSEISEPLWLIYMCSPSARFGMGLGRSTLNNPHLFFIQ